MKKIPYVKFFEKIKFYQIVNLEKKKSDFDCICLLLFDIIH